MHAIKLVSRKLEGINKWAYNIEKAVVQGHTVLSCGAKLCIAVQSTNFLSDCDCFGD